MREYWNYIAVRGDVKADLDANAMYRIVRYNLIRLRENHHLTQAQLAKAIGCSATTISHFESGQRKPTLARLVQLSFVFDCALDEFFAKV